MSFNKMKIVTKAQAGSFESSDILILVEPVAKGAGRKLTIDSGVFKQYGSDIERLITRILNEHQVDDIHLIANDKGAIIPVIEARMETVLQRASGNQKGTLY